MDYTKIGSNIRNIREKELKITREEFAEELGVSTLTISRLENASRKVKNIETYSKISNISGYSIEQLLSNHFEANKNLIDKIVSLLSHLSDDDLIYLYEHLRIYSKFKKKRNNDYE